MVSEPLPKWDVWKDKFESMLNDESGPAAGAALEQASTPGDGTVRIGMWSEK